MTIGIMADSYGVLATNRFKTALGSNVGTSSGTSLVITTTAAIAIGDLVVVRVASDNLSATTPTVSCTDSGGNTYTVIKQQAVQATAAAGCMGCILATKATAAVANGGTITLTFSGAIAHKVAYAESFVGFENTLRNAAVSTSGAASSSTITTGSASIGDLVVGALAGETRGTITADTDTLNGAWSTQFSRPSITSGTDSAAVSTAGQYKIPTAAAAQVYNVGHPSSIDYCILAAVFQKSP